MSKPFLKLPCPECGKQTLLAGWPKHARNRADEPWATAAARTHCYMCAYYGYDYYVAELPRPTSANNAH